VREGSESVLHHVETVELLSPKTTANQMFQGEFCSTSAVFCQALPGTTCGVGHHEPRLVVGKAELLGEGIRLPGHGTVSVGSTGQARHEVSASLAVLLKLLCSVGANDCCELRLKLLRVFASGVMFEETQVVVQVLLVWKSEGRRSVEAQVFQQRLVVGNEEIALSWPGPARSLRRKARWMVAIPAVKA
jgi:hypothetical protein